MKTGVTFAQDVARSLRDTAATYVNQAKPQPADIDLSAGEIRVSWALDGLQTLPTTTLGQLSYQEPLGLVSLRDSYIKCVGEEATLPNLTAENVMVTSGAKQALWFALATKVRPGDRILVPNPGWPPFRVWAALLGAEVSYYDASDASANGLLPAICSGRFHHAIINSPNNPTGAEYSQITIDALASEAARTGTSIIADEVYRGVSEWRASFLRYVPRGDVIVADSISKSAAAAGLRIGFLTAGPDVIRAALSMRSVLDSCPPGVTQVIASHLISFSTSAFRARIRSLARGTIASLSQLLSKSGIEVASSGGIYVWARHSDPCESVITVSGITIRGVAGSSFGAPGFIRLCPVTDHPEILAALSSAGAVP